MKSLTLVCALLGAFLPAQNIVYHDDANPTTGPGNGFPFGSEGVRTQQLIPGSVLGTTPAVITDILVNPQVATSGLYAESQVYYGDFEVRIGTTQLTTLTSDWASNSTNAITVYRGPLLVHFVADQWVPLGLPTFYVWNPISASDNLLVDFICWDVIDSGVVPYSTGSYFMTMRRSPSNSISRAYRLNWTSTQAATSAGVDGSGIKIGFLINDGEFVSHEGSCAGSSTGIPKIRANPGTWPQAGMPFDVLLRDGPSNSFASLVLSLQSSSYLGLPLPLDLSPIGAPGCTFWHGWEVLLPAVATDAAGSAQFTLQFPASTPGQFPLYASWITLDGAANPFGIVPSGFAMMVL